jgi:hypothetical protein
VKVIGINPFDKCVQTFDVPIEAAELIPNHRMCFACWLNGTDALYAVERPIVQQYFCITGGYEGRRRLRRDLAARRAPRDRKLPRYVV